MSNRARALLIWTLVSMLMILHFFLLLSVGVIASEVRRDLHISALELSIIASAYLYIYVILQTPVGVLLDIFGARKLLSGGAFVSAFGCWLFASSNSLTLAIIARVLMGGGLSFVFVASIELARKWFHSRYLGLMIGLSEAAGMLGSIIGNILLAFFLVNMGWRNTFHVAAIVAVALGALVWLWVRDHPHGSLFDVSQKPNLFNVVKDLRVIVKEADIWLHSGYMALMYVAVPVFSGLWATPFLQKAFALNLEQATIANNAFLVGVGFGSPFLGIICTNMRARVDCMVYGAMVFLASFCAVLYITHLDHLLINLLMFIVGLSSSASILSFSIVSEEAPPAVKSTCVGFVNTQSFVAAIILGPMLGLGLNLLSSAVNTIGLETYSAQQYRIVLSAFPILGLVSVILALAIRKRTLHKLGLKHK